MKKLLIIHKKQFGYHTDTFELCEYLAKDFKITYICFDSGLPKFENSIIDVRYISNKSSFFFRAFRFLTTSFYFIERDFDFIFLDYFAGCSLLSVFSRKEIILDFRTGSVFNNKVKRIADDKLRTIEAKFFNSITVISEGLKKKLDISDTKSFILPLGANVLSMEPKQFDFPRLFYIGTLNNREIHKTIHGVSLFLDNNPSYKNYLTYDIVGSGNVDEEIKLKNIIKQLKLNSNITLYGRKSHNEVKHLFDKCNIGVSYIPKTPYYEHQPPTKTFEYILAGMACIATSTVENSKYINSKNGILHEDNPEAFSIAFENMIHDFSSYSSRSIQQTLQDYTWEKIANNLKIFLLNGD